MENRKNMPYNHCTPWNYYGVGFALSIQDEDLQMFIDLEMKFYFCFYLATIGWCLSWEIHCEGCQAFRKGCENCPYNQGLANSHISNNQCMPLCEYEVFDHIVETYLYSVHKRLEFFGKCQLPSKKGDNWRSARKRNVIKDGITFNVSK